MRGESSPFFQGSHPYGKVVKKASQDRDEILVCPVDLSVVGEIRAGWSFPFRDRRVDSLTMSCFRQHYNEWRNERILPSLAVIETNFAVSLARNVSRFVFF